MTSLRNIGIITSGGDAGGLNGVIRGAAGMCRHLGIGARIIPNGYAGLYNLVDIERLVSLDPERADRIDATRAGSEAGHSRVKISRIDDPGKYDRIVRGLARHQVDALVISGGDDTGSVVVDLVEHGIRCVHAPKTMDLDLQTYSVGGDSAVNRIAQMVQDAKTTGATHNRIMITEVFGRYAGHTALRGGLGADADCILLPEVPADMDIVYAHAKETPVPAGARQRRARRHLYHCGGRGPARRRRRGDDRRGRRRGRVRPRQAGRRRQVRPPGAGAAHRRGRRIPRPTCATPASSWPASTRPRRCAS